MTNSAIILVVDDSVDLCEAIGVTLEPDGYQVVFAHNGIEALKRVETTKVDMILLDILMPGMDGFQACVELRKRTQAPIMMVSALDDTESITLAYRLGADDFLCKPFGIHELRVRVAAILERVSTDTGALSDDLRAASLGQDIALYEDLQQVHVRGTVVSLTRIESRLLAALLSSPDRPHGIDELFRQVWGYDAPKGSKLVEAAVRQLQAKIETDASSPMFVRLVEDGCYMFGSAK